MAGLDRRAVECSRDEDQRFSARPINGTLTATAAISTSAIGSSFLFDMSVELKTDKVIREKTNKYLIHKLSR